MKFNMAAYGMRLKCKMAPIIGQKFYNLGYLFLLILDFTYQTEHIFYIPEAHMSLYHTPDYKIIIFPILSIFTQLIKFSQYFKYTG
jgi:hypothetical protein